MDAKDFGTLMQIAGLIEKGDFKALDDLCQEKLSEDDGSSNQPGGGAVQDQRDR